MEHPRVGRGDPRCDRLGSAPKISSTDLFQRIKGFLVAEKESGRVLASVDDLFLRVSEGQRGAR